MMPRRSTVLLMVAFLAVACSGSSQLRGEIVVVGKTGQIVPGANVDVILIQATDAFAAEWGRAVNDIQPSRERRTEAVREAEARQAKALAERDAASRNAMEILQAARVDWVAYDRAVTTFNGATEQLVKATRRTQDLRAQLDSFARRQRSKGWHLITKYQMRVVRTDAEGRFTFAGMAPGRYFLASRFRVGDVDMHWCVPVVLEPNVERQAKLTENNAGWPFS